MNRPASTPVEDINEKGIKPTVENGKLTGVIINGEEKAIVSKPATDLLSALSDRHPHGEDRSNLVHDANETLNSLIDLGVVPVFTIPRQYIDIVLKEGLWPHQTDVKDLRLIAGTIGINPYLGTRTHESHADFPGNARFFAILKDGNKAKELAIQPRFTGTKNELMFRGVIATLRPIPLSELIIIDSKDMSVIYPANTDTPATKEPDLKDEDTQTRALEIANSANSVHRVDLDSVFANNYSPERLIGLLSNQFASEYDSQVDVSERYDLRTHTLMVLRQFEKYFSRELPQGIDKNFFRLVLALHDIGKPKAVKEGDKTLQHKYNGEIIADFLEKTGYSEQEIKLAAEIVSADPIGKLVKNKNINRSYDEIMAISARTGVSPLTIFATILVLYKSDASSYPSLASVFELESSGRLDFATDKIDLVYELEDMIRDSSGGDKAA